MGLKANKILKSEARHGDHIVVNRGNVYTHQGIYAEEWEKGQLVPRVYHQVNNKKGRGHRYSCDHCRVSGMPKTHDIKKSCLDCFLQGGSLRRFTYGANFWKMMVKAGGSCSTRECDSAYEVVDRAVKLYDSGIGFGKYNLLSNNCEAFAYYCKTGVFMQRSNQAIRGVTALGIGGAGCEVRYPLYFGYATLFGGGDAPFIACHVFAHRFRSVRVDKGWNLTLRSKKISVEDLKSLLKILHPID